MQNRSSPFPRSLPSSLNSGKECLDRRFIVIVFIENRDNEVMVLNSCGLWDAQSSAAVTPSPLFPKYWFIVAENAAHSRLEEGGEI